MKEEQLIICHCCDLPSERRFSILPVTSPPPSARNSVDTQSTRVMLDGEEFEVEFDETTDNVVGGQNTNHRNLIPFTLTVV